jgi:hypothetical protein
MQGVAAETVNYLPPARRFELSADDPSVEAAACQCCLAIVCSTLLAKAGMERVEGAAATQGRFGRQLAAATVIRRINRYRFLREFVVKQMVIVAYSCDLRGY